MESQACILILLSVVSIKIFDKIDILVFVSITFSAMLNVFNKLSFVHINFICYSYKKSSPLIEPANFYFKLLRKMKYFPLHLLKQHKFFLCYAGGRPEHQGPDRERRRSPPPSTAS